MKHGAIKGSALSLAVTILTVADNTYSVGKTDGCIVGDTSALAGNILVDLPLASECPGRVLYFKKTGGGNGRRLRIFSAGSDLIDDSTVLNLRRNYTSAQLISDGISTWYIF